MKAAKGSTSILISGLLFIGALFIFGQLIKPAYSQIKELQAQKAGKEAEYRQDQVIFDQVRQLISSAQNYPDLKKTISQILPVDPEIAQAVYQVSGMASASGLGIDSISTNELAINVSNSASLKGRGAQRLSISLTGSYEAFESFLGRLENNIRLFNVNNIRIEKAGLNPNILNFRMEIDTYYQTS